MPKSTAKLLRKLNRPSRLQQKRQNKRGIEEALFSRDIPTSEILCVNTNNATFAVYSPNENTRTKIANNMLKDCKSYNATFESSCENSNYLIWNDKYQTCKQGVVAIYSNRNTSNTNQAENNAFIESAKSTCTRMTDQLGVQVSLIAGVAALLTVFSCICISAYKETRTPNHRARANSLSVALI